MERLASAASFIHCFCRRELRFPIHSCRSELQLAILHLKPTENRRLKSPINRITQNVHRVPNQTQIEFVDTDMAGIVHFTRFFVFMETTEHEFLRSLGTSVATEWNGDKIGWPRLAASCEYLSPLRFEDEVDIRLELPKKGRSPSPTNFILRIREKTSHVDKSRQFVV